MTVEELEAVGLAPMDGEEISSFLASRSVGILGLQGEGAPVLRPMSYGYDGTSLYLRYVIGANSTKQRRSGDAAASFLVYSAETPFNWRSVLVTGTLSVVPARDRDRVTEAVDIAWRPDLLDRAVADVGTELYAFDVAERAGVKHLGLPPGLEDAAD